MTSYSGTFQYTQPTTDYNASDSPFVNTDGSFTTLTKSTSISGSDTIVSWDYVFDDSGSSSVDGLYLNGTITTPGNMTIDDFDNIPMSRQGSQFKNYNGLFPSTSTNIPTLLPNITCFEMFYGASNFNQDIGDWDTSTVSNMSYMFYDAYTFNQNISSKIANNGSDYLAWDTSNVTDMSYMFYRTGNPLQSFNNSESNTFGIAGTKPLNWNTTNVVNMNRMFNYCAYFNQYVGTKYITITNGLTTYNYISWDVKNVTDMNRIFDSAFNFNNGEIENSYTTPLRWNTIKVTTFERSFRKWNTYSSYSNRYNQNMYSEIITLEDSSTTYTSWNTSNVTTMYRMFDNTIFNNGASSGSGDNPMNWDMTSNTKCQYMFQDCSNFNSPVNFTNTNNVTTFAYMFEDCVLFNQPINFNTTSTNQIESMFARCSLFNQNIGSLNVTNLSIIKNIGNIIGLTNISITNLDKTLEGWASQSTPTTGISIAIDANYSSTGEIYRNILINTYGWNFSGTGSLVSSSLFQYTLPTSDYVASDEPIINTDSSFTTLQKSTEVSGSNTIVYRDFIFSDNGTTNDGLNLNAITTSTNMAVNDFGSIPLSRAGSSLLNYTGTVPSGLPTLLSNSSLSRMFEGATNYNQDVSSFDVSTVTNFSASFKGATSFNQNLGSWDISSATDMSNMLDNTTLSSINYGNTLKGWYELSNTPSNITLGASNLTYTYSTQTYQTSLTSNNNWTINDSGLTTTEYGVTYDNNTLVATAFDSTTLPSSGAINFRPNTVSITSSAFLGQTTITSVSIPSSMTSISSNAFKSCSGIKSITFYSTSSCSTISESAFENCSSLLNITIPSSVTTINNLSFNNCSSMEYAIMTSSGTPYTYTYTTETDQTTAMQSFLSDPSSWSQASVTTTTAVSSSDASISIVESPVTLTNDTRNSFVNSLFEENSSSFSSSVNSFVVDNTVLNIPVTISSVSTVRAFNAISGNGTNDFIVTEITTSSNIGTYVAMDTGSTIKINITDPSDSSSHYINVNKDNSTQSTIYIDGSTSGTTYNVGETVVILNNAITIGSVSQVQLLSSSISGNFQYTLPTSEYVASDEPIINNDNSFSILEKNVTTSGSNTIVTRPFSFDDNGTTNDGLNLNAITTSTNMAVNDFNSIPLSRAGSSLLNYTGTVPSGLPILLSNSSLTRMFEGATNYNQDVSTFDVSTVTNFSASFKGATSFNQNLGSWDISSATDMSNMFDNTDLSIANYSDTLIGWNNLSNTPSNITLGASSLTYNDDGEVAYNNLTDSQGTNWTINDSGLACVHESTDFLCYVDNEEKYINIKDIKPGFLVKTYKEGYVKVKHIFKQRCFNSHKNIINKFFVMDKSKNDLLTKDLIITGGHSILVDEITEEQHNKMKSTGIKYLSVYDKYKLVTFFNEDFVGKTDKSEERVYLLVLEADDDHKVYGAYVNGGMIIETCGIAMCKILKFL